MNLYVRWYYRWKWPWKKLLWLALNNPNYLPGERRRIEADYEQLEGDKSDCGGWTWDPPCGGCARCIGMQIHYYADRERQRRLRMAKLGLLVAPIQIPWVSDYSVGVQVCATWSAPQEVVKQRVARKKELGL